jgi:ATP-dependent helicase/nuclease subunit A
MGWTQAQQKVIDTRNKNLLVSAAAGSGKTAVLVERIISMISEGEHPLDIDHLLVVTFTNAAAAEMRERIGKAIDKKLLSEPDNLHLQKQMSLLQSAQITTIHSFCLNVIRNYFHRIDLDPSFKIAEESEITLMKSDVLSEVLERWYEEGREDFHAFIESYSFSKSDAAVEELILQLYNFSMSDPWPKQWLSDKLKMFHIASLEDMMETAWMKDLLRYVKVVLGDLLHKNQEALDLCDEPNGPTVYQAALVSDRNLLEQLRKADSYEDYAVLFPGITYDRLSSKREEGVAPWKKEKVKQLREDVKKGIKDLTSQYFFQSPEEMLKDLQAVKDVMKVLFELTLDFMEEFAKKKEEKNLIDFNDLEHFALKILVEETDDGSTKPEVRSIEPEINSVESEVRSIELEDNSIEPEESLIKTEDSSDWNRVIRMVPTLAAMELSEQFDEILIDEYQDSNMVQETILQSISRERIGAPNRFMVGDVKQSIYKFRLAMPEIFMEKYGSYSILDTTEEGEINLHQRIDLDKNFRSRKIVLDYVNTIFEQIMQESIGGIIYDDAASLKYGELYEELLSNNDNDDCNVNHENKINAENKINDENKINAASVLPPKIRNRLADSVEFILVTEVTNTEEGEAVQNAVGAENAAADQEQAPSPEEEMDEAIYTKKEMEARAIARRIKQLTDPNKGMLVFDSKAKIHRPVTNRDIVILLRSMSNWSEVFVKTLMQEGISAYADTGTGYFQTVEIMTILNMLHIIDNPRQDIPLVGVLYSPMVGLSTTELAVIRSSNRNVTMYTAVCAYAKEGSDEELRAKLTHFIAMLEEFRSTVNHKPIHELIQLVLDRTGYYYYVSALPGGDRRKSNIDMLVSQAVRFEKGSYSGLFHFIRYIEKLHKYEVDFGEAAISGEQDNTVRIMSIHKSKGLEFPIVFVAGMSKQFNTQDLRSNIVLHSEYGVGPEYIDSKRRTKVPTLIKKVIQKKVQIENLGEELRVLYVAMTRAKEKLIMTGFINSMEEIKRKDFSFFELLSAKSYKDWVLPSMVNRMGRIPDIEDSTLDWSKDSMRITVVSKEELLQEEIQKQIFLQLDEQELLAINPEEVYDSTLKEEVQARMNFVYPYEKEAGLRVKMTVSELKKLGQFVDEELSDNLYSEIPIDHIETEESVMPTDTEDDINSSAHKEVSSVNNVESPSQRSLTLSQTDFNPTVPNFIRGKEPELTGTDRGTLYHKVLELLDLTKVTTREDMINELEVLVQLGKLKAEDLKKLKLDYIYRFTTSNVAKRMRQAQMTGKLYKEKQFVIGIKASDVMKELQSDELILIQGIIDVFFEENNELVLLDYKSDIVTEEAVLIKRYKVQLEYYRKALEQMLKLPVKEMILYSLPLGKEIRID